MLRPGSHWLSGCLPCHVPSRPSSSVTSSVWLAAAIWATLRSLPTSTSRSSRCAAGCLRPMSTTASLTARPAASRTSGFSCAETSVGWRWRTRSCGVPRPTSPQDAWPGGARQPRPARLHRACARPGLADRRHRAPDRRGQALLLRDQGPVQQPDRRLLHRCADDRPARRHRSAHGRGSPPADGRRGGAAAVPVLPVGVACADQPG